MVSALDIPVETLRERIDSVDKTHANFGNGVDVISAAETTTGHIGKICGTGKAKDFTNSGGLVTESFLLGPQTGKGSIAAVIDKICGKFPVLDPKDSNSDRSAAKCAVEGFESTLWRATQVTV